MADPRLWRWKAIDHKGKLCEGVQLDLTRKTTTNALIARNLHPVDVRIHPAPGRQCWHIRQKIAFMRQLATLLHAGISLSDSLNMLARQHPLPIWQALLQQLSWQVNEGEPFSCALKNHSQIFPPVFIALIHTGELTGQLDTCCHRLAEQQEQLYLLRKKVVKALRYPVFIILAAILVTFGMVSFVLPQFSDIYQTFDAPLPALTRAVMTLADTLRIWSFPLFSGTVILSLLLTLFYRKKTAVEDSVQRVLLRLPLFSALIRGQRLGQIFTTLAMTQKAGLPLPEGLKAVEQTLVWNLWRQSIINIQQNIGNGSSFSQSLQKETLFTGLCHQLITTGEETGSLDLMLQRLAEWHQEQANELADSLSATLEPVLMLVIGTIIGTLVMAMYLPLFQMGDIMS